MRIVAPSALRGKSAPAHRLAHPPLERVLRGLLEAAHIHHELADTLAEARALARSRDLQALLDAAQLAALDMAAEVDAAGLALGQVMAIEEPPAVPHRRRVDCCYGVRLAPEKAPPDRCGNTGPRTSETLYRQDRGNDEV